MLSMRKFTCRIVLGGGGTEFPNLHLKIKGTSALELYFTVAASVETIMCGCGWFFFYGMAYKNRD